MKDFDYFYSNKDSYFGLNPSDGLVDMLNKYDVKIGNALDIGAGEGRNSIYLATKGFNVTAVEPTKIGSNKISDIANKMKLKNVNVINDDFMSANINQKFDFIIAGTSLDHMELEYLHKSIDKIKSLMNNDCVIYVVVFTEKDPGYLKQNDIKSECSTFIKHYFKENELKEYFKDCDILFYNEYMKPDNSHGKPHVHGKAKLIARKK